MESVTWLRCRSATPPVLMHQDRRSRTGANFRLQSPTLVLGRP